MAKNPSCDVDLARAQLRQDVEEWSEGSMYGVRRTSATWRRLLADAGVSASARRRQTLVPLLIRERGEARNQGNPDAVTMLLDQIDNANDTQICQYDRDRSHAIDHDFWGADDMVEGGPKRRSFSGGGRPWYLQWWIWALVAGGSFALIRKGKQLVSGGGSNVTSTTSSSSGGGLLSLDQFRAIMPKLPAAKAQIYLPYLNGALQKWGITSPRSIAAFLANVALETLELNLLSEIWDPIKVPAQNNYEKIARLGNTQAGDGYKYRGRGALQLTGRGAYREAGAALSMDLEGDPDSVASNPVAIFGTAGWYWASHKLTPWADAGDFDAVVRGINCGSPTSTCTPYHLDRRQAYYKTALSALGAS